MHTLTVEAFLGAQAALHAAGAVPAPQGTYEQSIVDAGGMRPNVRLALPDEVAADMTRSGRASWWLGAMLGHNLEGCKRRDQTLDYEAGALGALMLINASNERHDHLSLGMFLSRVRRHLWGGHDRLAHEIMARLDREDPDQPMSHGRATLLRAVAAAIGTGDPLADPAPLPSSLWSKASDDAVVTEAQVGERGHVTAKAQLSDGRTVEIHQHSIDPADRAYGVSLRAGVRLRIDFAGRTPEHPGYIVRIHDLEDIELHERLKTYVAGVRSAREFSALRAVDADGREIAANDGVEIICDCLETHRGNRGRVVEVLGDMPVVRFGGLAKPVPCVGSALRLLKAA